MIPTDRTKAFAESVYYAKAARRWVLVMFLGILGEFISPLFGSAKDIAFDLAISFYFAALVMAIYFYTKAYAAMKRAGLS